MNRGTANEAICLKMKIWSFNSVQTYFVIASKSPYRRRTIAGHGERQAIRDRPTTRLLKAEKAPLCEGATSRTQAATPEVFRQAGDFATDAATHLGGLGPVEYHQSTTSPRTTPAHRRKAAGAAPLDRRERTVESYVTTAKLLPHSDPANVRVTASVALVAERPRTRHHSACAPRARHGQTLNSRIYSG